MHFSSVHETLAALDGRSPAAADRLSFRDLRDYILVLFPALQEPPCELLLYYMDDEDEQVRVTNDVELDEALRLMREVAVATGKHPDKAVCKIFVVATPLQAVGGSEQAAAVAAVETLPGDTEEMLAEQQKKQMAGLFVDLGKVVSKWRASAEHETLKRDLASLLHEPGCQEALMEIMANAKVRAEL